MTIFVIIENCTAGVSKSNFPVEKFELFVAKLNFKFNEHFAVTILMFDLWCVFLVHECIPVCLKVIYLFSINAYNILTVILQKHNDTNFQIYSSAFYSFL